MFSESNGLDEKRSVNSSNSPLSAERDHDQHTTPQSYQSVEVTDHDAAVERLSATGSESDESRGTEDEADEGDGSDGGEAGDEDDEEPALKNERLGGITHNLLLKDSASALVSLGQSHSRPWPSSRWRDTAHVKQIYMGVCSLGFWYSQFIGSRHRKQVWHIFRSLEGRPYAHAAYRKRRT
ncbi:hypothetical protein AcV5_005394 [Taiwanofungus camphoratus]|nr:hypothetical protein AcV5_005394 [Antrodia cinnamomea]KAI0929559.1 hypothetical protein AcV7_005055 [Antrodia cinnamomea]